MRTTTGRYLRTAIGRNSGPAVYRQDAIVTTRSIAETTWRRRRRRTRGTSSQQILYVCVGRYVRHVAITYIHARQRVVSGPTYPNLPFKTDVSPSKRTDEQRFRWQATRMKHILGASWRAWTGRANNLEAVLALYRESNFFPSIQ